MIDLAAQVIALLGAAFIFFASLGVWRFPDFYIRMHASSKATSLGLGLMVIAAAMSDFSWGTAIKAAAIILFIFLTNPIAAHLLSRAAYIHHVPLWKNSVADELQGKYSADHSKLES
jgi:multicomponent Na+:H+ antiporter subunit G